MVDLYSLQAPPFDSQRGNSLVVSPLYGCEKMHLTWELVLLGGALALGALLFFGRRGR